MGISQVLDEISFEIFIRDICTLIPFISILPEPRDYYNSHHQMRLCDGWFGVQRYLLGTLPNHLNNAKLNHYGKILHIVIQYFKSIM